MLPPFDLILMEKSMTSAHYCYYHPSPDFLDWADVSGVQGGGKLSAWVHVAV